MEEYKIDAPVTRKEFQAIAHELTGMTLKSINTSMKVERARKPSGAFASGKLYRLDAKRVGIKLVAPRKDQ